MEKVLSSGKKVECKELTALEEVLAYQFAGKGYDEKNVVGSAVLIRSVMAALSVVSVDGEAIERIKSLDEVYAMMANFKRKEWAEVMDLYEQLNEVDLGE